MLLTCTMDRITKKCASLHLAKRLLLKVDSTIYEGRQPFPGAERQTHRLSEDQSRPPKQGDIQSWSTVSGTMTLWQTMLPTWPPSHDSVLRTPTRLHRDEKLTSRSEQSSGWRTKDTRSLKPTPRWAEIVELAPYALVVAVSSARSLSWSCSPSVLGLWQCQNSIISAQFSLGRSFQAVIDPGATIACAHLRQRT